MRVLRTASLVLASLVTAAIAAAAGGPGTAYCFGVGCPCGNDDPNAGCVNSTGVGGLLGASGSASILADDLTFTGTNLPPSSVTLILAGTQQSALPFKDGLLCIGGTTERLWKHFNSGQPGVVTCGGVCGLFAEGGLSIAAGETWHFQMWFRDSPAKLSPCGEKANFTNAYTVVFTP